MPVSAHPWTITAKIGSGSGTIRYGAQVVSSGTGYLLVPNGTPTATVTVTPAAGKTVSMVVLDGTQVTHAESDYSVSSPANSNHTLTAYFAQAQGSVSLAQTAGGVVTAQLIAPTVGSISQTGLTGLSNGSTVKILASPNLDYKVTSILVGGAAVWSGSSSGSQSYNLTVNGAKTVSATFAMVPLVNARLTTASTSLAANTDLALDASSSSSNDPPLIYNFTVTSGDAAKVTLTTGAGSPYATFRASGGGSYGVTVTATSSHGGGDTAATTITVLDAPLYASQVCIACHSTRNPEQVNGYLASPHTAATGAPSCSGCHNPAGTLGHPYAETASMANVCRNCHADAQGTVTGHPVEIGSEDCIFCHNPHSAAGMPRTTHYNNVTSAGYPASYVTSRSECSNCHYDSAVNAARRQEWNKSGHALTGPSWSVEDFKTKSGCVQCHTTTGFIAYSTGKVSAAWGVAADKTKELLTCIGCHKDVPNGVLRTLAPLRPYADDPYLNRDLGKSNLCVSCHSGKRNGASITAQLDALADFSNLPFIDPHNHAAGGVLHGKVGYHFPGEAGTYAFYSSNSHRRIGGADFNGTGTSGPCIACHRNDTNSHTNKALINTMCGNCHGESFQVEQLYTDKQAFNDSLAVLKAMLEEKGHPYSATPPYFSNTNWGAGPAGAHTMGAAFNYVVLRNDAGAYAHNSAYARQLLFDSIDYLQNQGVTGSIQEALTELVGKQKITRETADSVTAYQARISCTVCHANTSGSHPAHLESGFGCAVCHSTSAVTNTSLIPGNATHVNGIIDLQAGPGRAFGYAPGESGATCSSISCHNNGNAVWGGVLECDGCHGAPPESASHQKHYGGTVTQAAYGSTGIAKDINANATAYIMNCGNCHPMDGSKHGNGTVEVELYSPQAPAGSLKALNPASAAYVAGGTVYTDARGLSYTKGTCSNIYCHSYVTWTSTPIPDGDPNWQSKAASTRNYRTTAWGGAALTCSGCHGNPTESTFADNDGGAGDSHSWMDSYGYQNLHTYNMGFAPVSCRYCHNDTVKQVNSYTVDGMGVRTLGDVPITGFAKHVNGSNDVSFDKQNPFVYDSYYSGTISMSLAGATYDPASKNCSNVSCHREQTVVKWGTPYRWYYNECDRCHSY